MFAEEFKRYMTQVMGGAVVLGKQCFSRKASGNSAIRYTETIDGSVDKHHEYRQEVGMKCSKGLILLSLLFRVIHSLLVEYYIASNEETFEYYIASNEETFEYYIVTNEETFEYYIATNEETFEYYIAPNEETFEYYIASDEETFEYYIASWSSTT